MYSNKGIEVLAINPQVLVEQEGEHSPKILLETLSQLSAFSGLSTAGLLALICRSHIKNLDENSQIIKTGRNC